MPLVTDDARFSRDASIINFTGLDIAVGSQFSIGWTITCANDVVYETISNPVPEPATMFLLGTGLIGLAAIGRKKISRSKK